MRFTKKAGITPFRSQAQRDRLLQLVNEGKFSRELYIKMEKATGNKRLPERLHKKKDAIK